MAVDTATKRYSMINFGTGAGLDLFPVPNGTNMAIGERHQMLDLYAGFTDESEAVSVTGREQRRVAAIIHRRRRRK